MNLFERINLWHQTTKGLIIFAVLEALATALFLYWAVTGGSWMDWLCVVILVSGFVQNVIRLIMRLRHG